MIKVALFALLAVPCAITGVLIGDREPPQITLRAEVINVPSPGGEVRIKYTVLRKRSCETRVDRLLFDAQETRFPVEPLIFGGAPGPLGESSFIAIIDIPEKFAVGEGRYSGVGTYVCNPIHLIWPIRVTSREVNFVVRR